jgi:single-strand DNA-binding protein
MINNSVLMGRMVATPELRQTSGGVSVTSFTLAVERSFVKQGEERQADFIDCVAWRNTADFIARYFQKGSMIAVTGSIQTRSYEDKNGNKRKATEIVIDNASFCGGKNENQQNTANYTPVAESSSYQPTDGDFEEIGTDDQLPF